MGRFTGGLQDVESKYRPKETELAVFILGRLENVKKNG